MKCRYWFYYTVVAWPFSKFDLDLYQATLIWECNKEVNIEEIYQNIPEKMSNRIDEIMKNACNTALPK